MIAVVKGLSAPSSDNRPVNVAQPAAAPQSPRPNRRRRRWYVRLPLAALLAYAIWCVTLYFAQDHLLFRRDLLRPSPPEDRLWAAKAGNLNLNLDAGGQVEAWFLPIPQAGPEHPAPVVIFFHGNAELIDNQVWFVRKYHELGCSVLLPEYRGYGRSAGKPSEAAIAGDAVQLYDQLIQRPDVDRRRIVFHGRSLGGGVAAQVAARRKPAALMLESTFTSVAVMAHRYLVPTWLVTNPFHTDEVLPTLDIPVFVAHGSLDITVPVTHGRQLSKLAQRATYVEYVCGHDDLPPPKQEDEHWRQIAAFLTNAGVLPVHAASATQPAR